MKTPRVLAWITCAALLGACADAPTDPSKNTPAGLAAVGSEPISAAVGTAAATPLVVRVQNAAGQPLPGVRVAFAVTTGGGSLSADTVTSNSQGQAQVVWTLGTAAGSQTASATVAGLQAVLFSANAMAGPAVSITKVAGDLQSAVVAQVVGDSLVVQVTDAHGNPVAGAVVNWSAAEGAGAVSPAGPMTDEAGRARTAWTLSTVAAEKSVSASVAGLTPVVFTATGKPGAPASITKVSGDAQQAAPGADLPEPVVVRVTDEHGNTVAGAALEWSIGSGGGSVVPVAATTDDNGEAMATWRLGSGEGTQSVRVSVAPATPTVFNATAIRVSFVRFTYTTSEGTAAFVTTGDLQFGPPGGRPLAYADMAFAELRDELLIYGVKTLPNRKLDHLLIVIPTLAVGEYPLGRYSSAFVGFYTGRVYDGEGSEQEYWTNSGAVIVTEVTAKRIRGTFRASRNTAPVIEIVEGSFDVTIYPSSYFSGLAGSSSTDANSNSAKSSRRGW